MSSPVLLWLCIGGGVVSFVGTLMVLIVAFRHHIGWGLFALFVPFGALVTTIRFWSESKNGLITQLAGSAVMIGALMLMPEVRTAYTEALAKQGITLPQLQDAPAEVKPKETDLSAQIAERRSRIETLEASFAEEGVVLMKQYQDLDRQRKALPPGDTAAIEKFNVAALTYSASTTRRKQMQQDIATAHTELDKLLDERSKAQVATRKP